MSMTILPSQPQARGSDCDKFNFLTRRWHEPWRLGLHSRRQGGGDGGPEGGRRGPILTGDQSVCQSLDQLFPGPSPLSLCFYELSTEEAGIGAGTCHPEPSTGFFRRIWSSSIPSKWNPDGSSTWGSRAVFSPTDQVQASEGPKPRWEAEMKTIKISADQLMQSEIGRSGGARPAYLWRQT